MRITWVTRSFLDYRIPVYEQIHRLSGEDLTVIYYADVVPDRCIKKLKNILGNKAIGLTGEFRFTGKKSQPVSSSKKKGLRIPFQPGLIRKTLQTKPDVLLSDGFFQWTYSPLLLRLIKRVPHVMCYEATKHTERNTGYLRTLYRKIAAKLIDHIVCNGQLCSEYVQSLNYPDKKISFGNMAADTSGLQNSAQNLTTEEKLELKQKLMLKKYVFLFIGRLVQLKGVRHLVDAWLKIFNNKSDVSLLIVGEGPESEELKEITTNTNSTNVHYAGRVNYDDIYKYFAISDAFVIPTLQDNWSLVVPEAMSCGLPILCSKYNGCWPELVQQENGWVFDPLNTDDFVNTLEMAWQNREKWDEKGKNSLEIIKEHTPEKVANSIYQACVSVKS
ncbi:glycosyltransferase family 4 protein [Rhodohalobacter sulfatireducens]|uniref:Glycosyltransferase family 4 protein n=1 Tax=Rhodohalobacter sulfatireducens TaxID=2911366 RepID=A0ABS9KIW8_9BACT|nr:glycosyltransferase family 4 protein [Rhodohalobacter sulfatireducens]MCG2590793.1 glycosyltransferase family 4 protein [Rhodohalobacter sulfatireducens]